MSEQMIVDIAKDFRKWGRKATRRVRAGVRKWGIAEGGLGWGTGHNT